MTRMLSSGMPTRSRRATPRSSTCEAGCDVEAAIRPSTSAYRSNTTSPRLTPRAPQGGVAPMPVTLVTGTSTGIGFATALHLAKHGHTVVATMRNLAKAGLLEAAAREQGLRLAVRELDVTDQASIDHAMAETWGTRGRGGRACQQCRDRGRHPLELTPEAEHREMFESNYWGPIRMIQAVLPSMRERRAGYIVNVTSIAGRIATPNQIPYSASKHALAAASEALAHEVAAFEASATRASRRRWRRRSWRPSPPTGRVCATPWAWTRRGSLRAGPASATRSGWRWGASCPTRSTTAAS